MKSDEVVAVVLKRNIEEQEEIMKVSADQAERRPRVRLFTSGVLGAAIPTYHF